MALLAIEDFSVSYGKAEAVRSVSVEVEKGKIATVIGPNGAGKTQPVECRYRPASGNRPGHLRG